MKGLLCAFRCRQLKHMFILDSQTLRLHGLWDQQRDNLLLTCLRGLVQTDQDHLRHCAIDLSFEKKEVRGSSTENDIHITMS
jgi:hypothetical protein